MLYRYKLIFNFVLNRADFKQFSKLKQQPALYKEQKKYCNST